jgi:hypothetical protein
MWKPPERGPKSDFFLDHNKADNDSSCSWHNVEIDSWSRDNVDAYVKS